MKKLAPKHHLSWRSWSSPHCLALSLGKCSDALYIPAFISSIPITLGCNNFMISPRKKLNSGSGIGGISSDVVIRLYSRSTTTTYTRLKDNIFYHSKTIIWNRVWLTIDDIREKVFLSTKSIAHNKITVLKK